LTAVTRPSDPEHALRASSPRRPLVALLCLLSIAAAPARAQEPRIDDVEESLVHDPSYKVRVEAALILGKLREQRSVPALMAALKDGHPAVRATSARSLGMIGAPIAREALTAALHDPVQAVRHMAREALRGLGGVDDSAPHEAGEASIRRRSAPRLSFEVRPVGDPRNQAGPVLRSHMRDFLVQQLRPIGEVSEDGRANYAIGGIIKNLYVARGGQDVEVICAVQLVVMRQPGNALFLMTFGEAHVQKPKRQFRPHLQASMELEAVEGAVRGASEDLISQLAR